MPFGREAELDAAHRLRQQQGRLAADAVALLRCRRFDLGRQDRVRLRHRRQRDAHRQQGRGKHDPQPDRLRARQRRSRDAGQNGTITTTTFGYDNDSQLTSDGTTGYTYDGSVNRTGGTRGVGGGSLPGNTPGVTTT